MRLLPVLGALQGMKYFVALVDAGTRFMLPCEPNGIVKMTNDSSVAQMQFGHKVELDGHIASTNPAGRSSRTRRDCSIS
jgi:hypothetical protein